MKLKGEPKLQENPITKVPEVAANVSPNQEGAHPSASMDDKNLSEIIDERNRLVRSVMEQPIQVVRDLATLAVGWVMRELQLMEKQHRAPFDQLSWVYAFRIIGLADGQYGNGFMVRTNEDGSQTFDTSTFALVAQLHEQAGIGVKR
jgi:hypothetical protein